VHENIHLLTSRTQASELLCIAFGFPKMLVCLYSAIERCEKMSDGKDEILC